MYLVCKKGDGCFKILQKEIREIQICAEIFQKNFSNLFLGVLSFILDKKKLRKKFQIFFIFTGGTLRMIFFKFAR